MLQSLISRAALGRRANIGDLYDATTDTFVNRSIFKVSASDLTFESDLDETSTNLVQSDSIADKLDAYDVEPELQLSVLTGMVKLSDSWELARQDDVKVNTLKSQLICNVKTVTDEINIKQNKKQIDTDALSSETEATHVVVGIDWGAVYSVTCQYLPSPDANIESVVKELGETMKNMEKAIAADDVSDTRPYNTSKNTFIFKCNSQLSPPAKDLDGTFEPILAHARNMPTFVKETDNEKGVPLVFTLMPLESVSKLFKPKIAMQTRFNALDEDIITKTVGTAQQLSNMNIQIQEIQATLHASENYFTVETLAELDGYAKTISEDFASFTAQVKLAVTKIRRAEDDTERFEILAEDWAKYCQNESRIADFEVRLQTLKMIKRWEQKGVHYIGRKDQFNVNFAQKVYVFYASGIMANSKVAHLFWKYHTSYSDHDDTAFVVVNMSLRPDLCSGEEHIKVFTNGSSTCEDLYKEEGENAESCLVLCKQKKQVTETTRKRAQLKICCPGSISGKCSKESVMWKCFDCKQLIEYGLGTRMFYCKCGSFMVSGTQFRCTSVDHGLSFVDYPEALLQTELSHLQPFLEKNILILGETGVGKSTWINGVYNYLNFPNLQAAKDTRNPLALIPARFELTKDGKRYDVKIGKESGVEEKLETGCSATQSTKSYLFHGAGCRIRLIDTPGIGDCRGLEQDKKNFDNILQFLCSFEEIHAICILLKPNCARLTVMFRFCIQELLAQLHSSAVHNILFCFTNSRGTFYQPGDTLGSLNKMLEDNSIKLRADQENTFCFDNEAFRFLACLQNGVKFSEEEEELYSKSWEKSVNVTSKMFTHITNLPPHYVRNTISMNEARRITLALSKPMAEVAARIQENEQMANKQKNDVQEDKVRMGKLQEGLRCTVYDLERENLSHGMTVCTHYRCVDEVEVGRRKSKETVYKTVCHDPCDCFLWGAAPNTRYTAGTGWCTCTRLMYLFSQPCTKCGHDYGTHMYIDYKLKQVERELIDEDVMQQILQKSTEKEQKEEYIRQIDKKIKELENEKKTILEASATFGAFLKQNALIPFNDAVKDYLEMIIQQEQEKAEHIRDKEKMDSMKLLLQMYEEDKKRIDEIEKLFPISPEDIKTTQDKLFGLEHYGRTLEEMFNGISISKSAQSALFPEQVVLLPENESPSTFQSPSLPASRQSSQASSKGTVNKLVNFFKGLF